MILRLKLFLKLQIIITYVGTLTLRRCSCVGKFIFAIVFLIIMLVIVLSCTHEYTYV